MRHATPNEARSQLGCSLFAAAGAAVLLSYALGLNAERGSQVAAWSEPARLTILHTNDVHGQLLPERSYAGEQGFVALGRAIRQERDRAQRAGHAVLLLDAGDFFQGTPESNLTGGEVVVAWMNHLGYDAATVGNHEFDFGQEVPARLAELAEFPLLGANIIDEATGRPVSWLGAKGRDRVVDGSVLIRALDVGGRRLRVGVIGVSTRTTKEITVAGVTDGLVFGDEVAAVEALLDGAGLPRLDAVILLSHSGLEVDRELARRLQGRIDVIVGGHTHQLLPEGERVGSVVIAHAGAKAKYLGKVELAIQPPDPRRPDERARVEARARVQEVGDDIGQVLAPYVARFEEQANQPVGTLVAPLEKVSGYASSTLGNLQTDLMRELTGADVAVHNQTGIRASIDAGEVTWREVYQVSPFGNSVVTMRLSGADLRDLFEGMLGSTATLLEVSGVVVVADPSRPPGSRLVELTIDGAPVDPARRYLVATNSFLAGGRDGHVVFNRGTDRQDRGTLMRELLIRFLGRNSPYDPGQPEPRLVLRQGG